MTNDEREIVENLRLMANGLPVSRSKAVASAAADTIEQLAATVAKQDIAMAEYRKQTGDATGDNVMWLLEKFRQVHDALCPDKLGVWTREVEQAVEAAIDAGATVAKLPVYADTGRAFVPGRDTAYSMFVGVVCPATPAWASKYNQWRFLHMHDYALRAYSTAAACEEAEGNAARETEGGEHD